MSTLSDIDIRQNLGRQIIIHPICDESITAVGYDLRIGLAVNLSDKSQPTIVDKKIIIPALSSTFIISKEHVWISDSLIGTLHSRGSLSAKGLIVNSTTVDPNWSGQLTFLVFNSSRMPLELDAEAPFVTLILHRVATPTLCRAKSNPISVATKYGERFGAAFQKQLLDHLADAANKQIERAFEEQVRKACAPSLWSMFRNAVKTGSRIGNIFSGRIFNLISKLLVVLGLIGLPCAVIYWKWIEPVVARETGMQTISLNAEALAGFVAAWIALFGIAPSVLKRE